MHHSARCFRHRTRGFAARFQRAHDARPEIELAESGAGDTAKTAEDSVAAAIGKKQRARGRETRPGIAESYLIGGEGCSAGGTSFGLECSL